MCIPIAVRMSCHESAHGRDQPFGLVALGAVAARAELEQLGLGQGGSDAFNLLETAVFVVEPLHREQLAGN